MSALTQDERQYFDQLFDAVAKDDTGVLPGSDALPLLTASGLPQQTLGEIWALADPDNNGFLTKDGWYIAARVIGQLQKGGKTTADASLAARPGPLPTFSGFAPPPAPKAPTAGAPPALAPNLTGNALQRGAPAASPLPPLTAADRTKFTRIFVGCGPHNGLVSGDRAKDVFLKSKLGYEHLGQIWNLADTQQRGALDLPDFIVGMYLIQACMANPSLVLPTSLPPGTYEAAGGRGTPGAGTPLSMQHSGPRSPIQRQYTGGSIQPQLTGGFAPAGVAAASPSRSNTLTPTRQPTLPLQQQHTAGTVPAFSAGASPAGAAVPWDVTPAAKATSDGFFAQLDTQNRGVIEGDVAVPFMVQSQLDENVLASIWDLSDIRQEGKLDRDEFAVAMYLINAKLQGKELPTVLPQSLIPPALRSGQTGAAGAASTAQGPSSTSRDLFDLFDDEPPASTTPTLQASPAPAHTSFLPQPPSRRGTLDTQHQFAAAAPQVTRSVFASAPAPAPAPQPAGDLLGEGEAHAALPDHSADIGNAKNQLSQTNRSVGELQKTRAELEKAAAASAAELEALEKDLATSKAKYEEETKHVADLRVRVSTQSNTLTTLRADVIRAESDLTAMRMEKDELEQALLKDKEEVRGMQKQMKELEDEKSGLKLLLDKIKKEARQQKGMVSIAKKQVSTAEASRDAVQAEVRDAEKAAEEATVSRSASPAKAAGVPLPTSPRALSPEATGASQRSNNPFDMFNRASLSRSTSNAESSVPTGAFAGAGAIAGAGAAAGALYAATHGSQPSHSPEIAGQESRAAADPFGAQQTESHGAAADPFGAPVHQEGQSADPFGVPSGPHGAAGGFDSVFGDSFDDSFGQNAATPKQGGAPGPSDFDSAFADFDDDSAQPSAGAEPAQQPFQHAAAAGSAEQVTDRSFTPVQHEGAASGTPVVVAPAAGHETPQQLGGQHPETSEALGQSHPGGSATALERTISGTAFERSASAASGAPVERTLSAGSGTAGATLGRTLSAGSGNAGTPLGRTLSAGSGTALERTQSAGSGPAHAGAEPADLARTGSNDIAAPVPVPVGMGLPSGIPKSAVPDSLRPGAERTASTQAVAPSSPPATPGAPGAPGSLDTPAAPSLGDAFSPMAATTGGDESSDDDDEGPEDLEAPRRRDYSSRSPPPAPRHNASPPPPVPPVPPVPMPSSPEHKTRRSAPPPPTARSASAAGSAASPPLPAPVPTSPATLDPFGASTFGKPSPAPTQSPAAQHLGAAPAPTHSPAPAEDPFGAPVGPSNPSSTSNQAPPASHSATDPFGAAPFNTGLAAAPFATGLAAAPFANAFGGSDTTQPSAAPAAASTSDQGPGAAEPAPRTAELDPFGASFGAPLTSPAPGGALPRAFSPTAHPASFVPKTAQFDDEDDFDFGDLPATQGNASAAVDTSAFDDEFANFDDDFDKVGSSQPSHDPSQVASQGNSGSVNTGSDKSMLQSYEVVPKSDGLDEWGMSSVQSNLPPGAAAAAPQAGTFASGFSFDDAFGLPSGGANNDAAPAGPSAPGGFNFDDAFGNDAFGTAPAPPQPPNLPSRPNDAGQGSSSVGASKAPELPTRPQLDRAPSGPSADEQPQADDLEDVKKLCQMGFPRSLVVEALGANGYDFQKALNVLLVK